MTRKGNKMDQEKDTKMPSDKPVDAGIDYGMGETNRDKENGISYGVISQHDVMSEALDDFEADYGKPDVENFNCPSCGTTQMKTVEEAGGTDGELIDWGDSLECESCGENYEVELPDCAEPLAHYYTEGNYSCQMHSDGDIFIIKSEFYTRCNFSSPCAPGAGYLTSSNPDGIMAYCLGHDWFESKETGKWIECTNCKGTGLHCKADIPHYKEENWKDRGLLFDDYRVKCWACKDSWKVGLQGKKKESYSKAPYSVFSVETGKEVQPS